jgi:hypothetical protein
MDLPLANGIWIGAASLFVVLLLLLPFIAGRQNFRRRVVVPIFNMHNFLRRFCSQPRSMLFLTISEIFHSVCRVCKAFQIWIGRFHGRKLRPRLWRPRSSLLPLLTMRSRAFHRPKTQHTKSVTSFTELPFDIRVIIYREFVRLFTRTNWKVTTTLRADPTFVSAMAFISTCKLVREELGPRMFQAFQFETDAKYPFYKNLPRSLTCEIQDLCLHFRPSMDLNYMHHTLLRQLIHLQALRRFTATVRGQMLVDLDHELEYILRRFKQAHSSLQSLTVTT